MSVQLWVYMQHIKDDSGISWQRSIKGLHIICFYKIEKRLLLLRLSLKLIINAHAQFIRVCFMTELHPMSHHRQWCTNNSKIKLRSVVTVGYTTFWPMAFICRWIDRKHWGTVWSIDVKLISPTRSWSDWFPFAIAAIEFAHLPARKAWIKLTRHQINICTFGTLKLTT